VPPAAWDDDQIADPAAAPAQDWQRSQHRGNQVLIDEYEDLAALGYTREQAAERLGVPKNTLDRALARAARKPAA
jgi:predicted DNA-binding protein (UPF0251 family)